MPTNGSNLQSKVFLTGATGFIGSHVLETLTAAGFSVVVFARPKSSLTLVQASGAEIRYGDLRDPSSVGDAMRGCGQVVHTAGLAADWGRFDDFFSTNVTGTLNVLAACRENRIRHTIITGSISSYGEEDCASVKDETWPYASHYPYWLDGIFPSGFNAYRDTKAQATSQAVAFAELNHLDVTVLEPAWVFGEREFGTGFYAYLKAVRDGQKLMPGSTRNRFHVVYARDLARAYLLAVQRQLPGVERIIIGYPKAPLMCELFDQLCREAGLKPPRRLPKWMLYPIGFGLELACSLARCRRPPLMTRGRINMFYDSIQFSTAKASRLLGFECEYSLEQAIRRTVAWYREQKLL